MVNSLKVKAYEMIITAFSSAGVADLTSISIAMGCNLFKKLFNKIKHSLLLD